MSNPGPFLLHDFVTGFVARVTRWVPLVEQALPTLPKHMSSSPVSIGACVIGS